MASSLLHTVLWIVKVVLWDILVRDSYNIYAIFLTFLSKAVGFRIPANFDVEIDWESFAKHESTRFHGIVDSLLLFVLFLPRLIHGLRFDIVGLAANVAHGIKHQG